jgi:hypothetical protein
MSSPEYAALHIIHILALLGLVGAIFYACAAAPEQRKRTLIWSGVASVLVAATGARMSQGIYHGMPAWVWVKLACWLGLAALVGFAYRRHDRSKMWIAATLGLAALALAMVYLKPF